MILNKCQSGMAATYWLNQIGLDNIEKKLYQITLTTGNVKSFADEVEKFMSTGIAVDGILLDATGEAPEEERYIELIDILVKAGYDRNRILCIDSGLTFLWASNHVILPWWMDHTQQKLNFPINDRTRLFLVLARLAKYHRVKLISKLVENGLDSLAVMTCGCNSSDEGSSINNSKLFDELVPPTIRHKFPIIINNQLVDRTAGTAEISDDFKRCLVNVVMETGFENQLFGANGPPSLSWNRLFYTEKTDKCFLMDQIPVFLAKKGYVSALRNIYGFDVFDDIIDHSYDNIDDPFDRISAVADECVRISKLGLENLKSIAGLRERFEFNRNQIRIVKNRIHADSELIMQKWLEKL